MLVIQGKVVRGKGEGRAIGYPTANFEYQSSMRPETGVWTCRSEVDGRMLKGLAVIGMWKLANGLPSCEVHYLDFKGDLYERVCGVSLGIKLRPLKVFTDLAGLQQQIQRDIEEAGRVFAAE